MESPKILVTNERGYNASRFAKLPHADTPATKRLFKFNLQLSL